MTDTPERLWAAEDQTYSTLSFQGGTEYVHADLLDAEIEAHAETLAALRAFIADLDKANERVAELEADIRQSKCEAVSYLGQLHDTQGRALAAEARVAELGAQIEGLLKIVHSNHEAFCQTEEAAARPYQYK